MVPVSMTSLANRVEYLNNCGYVMSESSGEGLLSGGTCDMHVRWSPKETFQLDAGDLAKLHSLSDYKVEHAKSPLEQALKHLNERGAEFVSAAMGTPLGLPLAQVLLEKGQGVCMTTFAGTEKVVGKLTTKPLSPWTSPTSDFVLNTDDVLATDKHIQQEEDARRAQAPQIHPWIDASTLHVTHASSNWMHGEEPDHLTFTDRDHNDITISRYNSGWNANVYRHLGMGHHPEADVQQLGLPLSADQRHALAGLASDDLQRILSGDFPQSFDRDPHFMRRMIRDLQS